GIGTELYARLTELSKEIGAHLLIGIVASPNPQSRRLHEKFGFKQVGCLKEAGYKFNTYIDIEIWQLIL
ncbi:MAG: GNAT family N-acetyltransferase, partial [Bacteroidales bacterium]|nr:GNAT family N-acetyltransferase [Bacteroidales bacterium]